MGKADDQLVNDAILPDGTGQRYDLNVVRPMANKVIAIKCSTSDLPVPPVKVGTWVRYGSGAIVAIVAATSLSTNSALTWASKTAPRFFAAEFSVMVMILRIARAGYFGARTHRHFDTRCNLKS